MYAAETLGGWDPNISEVSPRYIRRGPRGAKGVEAGAKPHHIDKLTDQRGFFIAYWQRRKIETFGVAWEYPVDS